MKKALLSLTILAVVFTFPACKKKDNPAPTTAGIMFVHGCAAGSTPINLDAKANNVAVVNASNKPFLQNSGYQNVTAGTGVNLSFFVTGLSLLTSASENLTVGAHYTAFAGGTVLAPTFVFTTDDLNAPTSGNAKIRFVNLTNDTLHITANVQSNVIATGVNSKGVSPFVEVAAGTYSIKAGDPANLGSVVILGSGSQQLGAGKIYTLMLTGALSGSGTSGLMLTLITNN